jgi:uncharacterized MAPEG superfamily protein
MIMQIVILSLVFTAFMPIILALSTIPLRAKQFGKPDINSPREQAAKFEGLGQRLTNAQSNAWEALGLYGASILAMIAADADFNKISSAAIVFMIARTLHAIFYALNLGALRFFSFLVAAGSVSMIFIVAYNSI